MGSGVERLMAIGHEPTDQASEEAQMSNLAEILNVGTGNAWLFAPSAILLGALHGLEPGHSKTMMAAFIIAIRGTVAQAILLGLAATLSHTAIVWIIALGGLYFGSKWTAEGAEPYLQIVSGLLIIGVAGWMSWRNWRDHHSHAEHSAAHHGHEHHDHEGHDHDHDHDHGHAVSAGRTGQLRACSRRIPRGAGAVTADRCPE